MPHAARSNDEVDRLRRAKGDERDLVNAWRGLLPYVRGNAWLLAVVTITAPISGFAEAGLLYLIVQAASAAAAGQDFTALSIGPVDADPVALTNVIAAALVVVGALAVLAVFNAAGAAALSARTLKRVRKLTFYTFMNASWEAQSQEPEGRLQQLLDGYVGRVGTATLQMTQGLTALLSFGAYMVSALLINAAAAGVVLIVVSLIGVLLLPLARRVRRLARDNMRLGLNYSRVLAQSVRLAREIRVFDVAEQVSSEVGAQADEAERMGFRARFLTRLTPQAYQYAALLLVVIGIAVVSSMDIGQIAELGAIVLLLVRALSYAQQMATVTQQLAESKPFVDELLDNQRRYERHRVMRPGSPLARVDRIEMRDATFAYQPGAPVLDELGFVVMAGEAVGIVGPSGSGKSTLAQLLLRLRSPQAGSYLINGEEAASFDLGEWSDRFAFVPQDNLLQSGTVADNIRFFRRELNDGAIERAARLAHLHEDIVALPEGYGTMLGPGARDLSGGQRQRLGLARALAAEPSVLVLDEPTSALDMRSEELIQQTLRALKKTTLTLFIIAHRMPSLVICDRILVLEGGSIAATGTHTELQHSSIFYQEALRLSHVRS